MWTEHFGERHKLGIEPLSDGTKITRCYCYTNERACEDGWEYDVHELPAGTTLKSAVISLITDYDSSPAVNSFTFNGVEMWIPKELRISLMNSTSIEMESGKTETTLWYNGTKFSLPIALLRKMLSAIELYALQCYNTTEAHKADVLAMDNTDDILAYDITSGYPEKLSF